MDEHSHCDNCYLMNCKYKACELIDCKHSLFCKMKMHQCKLDDHLNICLYVRVPCINSKFGCDRILLRFDLNSHLKSCPASVINCSFEYNRWPVPTKDNLLSANQFEPKLIDKINSKSSLNIALAFRDQFMLNELYKFKSLRQSLKNNLTRKYPAVPLLSSPYSNLSQILDLDETLDERSIKDELNDNLDDNLIKSNSLTKCSSFLSTASYTTSTVTNSDDDCDSPWQKKLPLGLKESICQKLTNNLSNQQSNGNLIKQSNDLIDEQFTSSDSSSSEANKNEFNNNTQNEIKKLKRKRKFKNPGKLDYLILDLNIEFLANHQIKPKKMYTFRCGNDFRRDEYSNHYQNVHSDIMGSLNDDIEHNCPLVQYGCDFFYRRKVPVFNRQKTQIIFDPLNKVFGHLIDDKLNLIEQDQNINKQITLTDLPIELISRIISYLDGLSIKNFSLTNKLLRSLCCDQLERKGLVSLIWKKEINKSTNQINWINSGFHWKFSNHFSLIKEWKFDNDHQLLNHLSNCKYFDRLLKKEPFKLVGLGSRN